MDNVAFSKAMFSNINSASYYPIKRSFGHNLQNCNIDAIIAYTKISQNDEIFKITERNVEFLVMGLCYTRHKQFQEIEYHYTKFEDVLKRLYITGTDSIKKDIEDFLKLRFDENGYFCKKFASLCNRVIPLLHNNETFDFIRLLNDLKFWDYSNQVKIRWATALVINKTNEENGGN